MGGLARRASSCRLSGSNRRRGRVSNCVVFFFDPNIHRSPGAWLCSRSGERLDVRGNAHSRCCGPSSSSVRPGDIATLPSSVEQWSTRCRPAPWRSGAPIFEDRALWALEGLCSTPPWRRATCLRAGTARGQHRCVLSHPASSGSVLSLQDLWFPFSSLFIFLCLILVLPGRSSTGNVSDPSASSGPAS
jgi:hypothetical protein